MGRRAEVRIDWAGEERLFRLPIGQLIELQEACDAGPLEIKNRLFTGRWLVQDVRETLRLGLIGGGTKDAEATKLIKRYVDPMPLLDNWPPACAVLDAALRGVPDEPLEQAKEGKEPGEAVAAGERESSPSPPSTPPAPSSDGPPSRSIE